MTEFGSVFVDEVRGQLRRIAASPDFEASDRNRRFLTYVVETTLDGRADQIKAYCIATDVFGRDASFDPQTDPIVRIEASRLRRALERYYLLAGASDPVKIEVPKGAYAPTFTRLSSTPLQPPAAPPPPGPVASRSRRTRAWLSFVAAGAVAALLLLAAGYAIEPWRLGEGTSQPEARRLAPTVLVTAFDEEGDHASFPGIAVGFTRDLVFALARFDEFRVIGPAPAALEGRPAAPEAPDYVMSGKFTRRGDVFVVDTMLQKAEDRSYVWAASFERRLEAANLPVVRNEIANQVARTVAQPYGVIQTVEFEDALASGPRSLTGYACVMRFYLYWRSYEAKTADEVQRCLEATVAEEPGYAQALAALSFIHSDAYRFGRVSDEDESDALELSLALSRKAVAAGPRSTRAYQSLALALWLRGDVEGSFSAAEAGLAINPNDTELLAETGMRLAYRLHWEEAVPILEAVEARNPGQPGAYRIGLFLHRYTNGQYEEALDIARRIEMPELPYGHIAVALAAAALGREDEAAAAVARLEALEGGFGGELRDHLERRNIHPDLVEAIVGGMRKAGLRVPERVAN